MTAAYFHYFLTMQFTLDYASVATNYFFSSKMSKTENSIWFLSKYYISMAPNEVFDRIKHYKYLLPMTVITKENLKNKSAP